MTAALLLRHWKAISVSLAIALLLAWGLRLDHLRAGWKERFDTLHGQAVKVVLAIEHATGDKAAWDTAPGQIVAMGEGIRQRDEAIRANNQRINDMAREAVRLRAKAAELKRLADKAEAQRRGALKRLSDLAITPGTRTDCMQLLREADEALNIVREAGI